MMRECGVCCKAKLVAVVVENVCFNVLVRFNVLQCVAVWFSVLQCVCKAKPVALGVENVCFDEPQSVVVCCSVLQCVAVCCSVV